MASLKLRTETLALKIGLADDGLPRKYFDVRGGNRVLRILRRVEAAIAQFEAELIFRLRMEGVATFAAGGICGPLKLFLDVNLWVNLKCDHGVPRWR